MKKIVFLFAALCCFLSSCEKEDTHSLDGSKWVYKTSAISSITIIMNDGYAMMKGVSEGAIKYTVKRNKVVFSDYFYALYREGSGAKQLVYYFDKVGTLNNERTTLTVSFVHLEQPDRNQDIIFNRVIE